VLAREEALKNGRRTAWNRMLAAAGIKGPNLSDQQIDNLVQSIMIEQERPSPTRYSGRITVNFSARAVRGVLGSKMPATVGAPGSTPGGVPGSTTATPGTATAPAAPAAYAEVIANFNSLQEWQEVRRRLRITPGIAGIEIRGLAIDAARLRLSLRRPASEVMGSVSGIGSNLVPAPGPGQAEYWLLNLAGGG
jgi:hypothetical protein